MTDEEMIDYLANARPGVVYPPGYHVDLALAAMVRRLLALEAEVAALRAAGGSTPSS